VTTPKRVDIVFPKSTPSLPSPLEVYPAPTYGVDIGLYRLCSRVHTRPPRALTIGLESVPPQQVYQVYLACKLILGILETHCLYRAKHRLSRLRCVCNRFAVARIPIRIGRHSRYIV